MTKPEDKKCCKCSKKYLRACVSDPGYNTRPLSQLIFCLVSVSPLTSQACHYSPLSSQSLLVPQLNIFSCPSAQHIYLSLSSKSLLAPQLTIFTCPSAHNLYLPLSSTYLLVPQQVNFLLVPMLNYFLVPQQLNSLEQYLCV